MEINDNEIIFVTNSIFTKWIEIEKKVLKHHFPESEHVIIDGRSNWPLSWFYWIDIVKKSNAKWFIHIEEDCFIEDRELILDAIRKMEAEDIDIMGTADGYTPYRGGNPLTMTPFFLIGKVDALREVNIDTSNARFFIKPDGSWGNNLGLHFKEEYAENFQYPYEKVGNDGHLNDYDIEPFYAMFWILHEQKKKLHYFYPNFNDNLKSLNPSLDKGLPPMVTHMFYTRIWNSDMDVHGLPNSVRYERLESYLKQKYDFLN